MSKPTKFYDQEMWELIRECYSRPRLVLVFDSHTDNQPDGFKSEDADAIKEQGGSA